MGDNMSMATRKRGGRAGALTAEDWVRAALRAIAEGGVGAVAVEPLAQQLGVTKGSFYWHFPNRNALLIAALEHWDKESTEAVIAAVDAIADPRERLLRLGAAVAVYAPDDGAAGRGMPSGHRLDLAIADAADDPLVRPILRRVTARRLAYLDECYHALGFPADEARHRALLVYAAYIGTLRLAREAPDLMPRDDDYRAYRRHEMATLVPEDATGDVEER